MKAPSKNRYIRWRDEMMRSDLPPTSCRVLYWMHKENMDYKTLLAYPSIAKLMEYSRLGERTVQYALKEAVCQGWLRQIEKGGRRKGERRASTYVGTFPPGVDLDGLEMGARDGELPTYGAPFTTSGYADGEGQTPSSEGCEEKTVACTPPVPTGHKQNRGRPLAAGPPAGAGAGPGRPDGMKEALEGLEDEYEVYEEETNTFRAPELNEVCWLHCQVQKFNGKKFIPFPDYTEALSHHG